MSGPVEATRRALRRLARRPSAHPNTIANNLEGWSNYDWSGRGEEWSNNPEWKASLVHRIVDPYIPKGSVVLEIGPGAGRWTEILLDRASQISLVDLTPRCIDICRERFKDATNIDYHVNDGRDLSFVPSGVIDRIWSFDVFVHIASRDVEAYVSQFPRILAPTGMAVIHHAKIGRNVGWRSDMTDAKMRTFARRHGLEVVEQFDSWDDGRYRLYDAGPGNPSPDVVSVLRKRG